MTEMVVTTGAVRHAKLQSYCHHQRPTFCPSCRPASSVRGLKEKARKKSRANDFKTFFFGRRFGTWPGGIRSKDVKQKLKVVIVVVIVVVMCGLVM